MSVTTKTGDSGFTCLLNSEEVPKYDVRVETTGDMDELTSYLGLAKSQIDLYEIKNELEKIQQNMITLMAHISCGDENSYLIPEIELIRLEEIINNFESKYPKFKKFILPGSSKESATLDVARAVSRRIERHLLTLDRLYPVNLINRKYVNRLSDFLYVSARYLESLKKNTFGDDDSLYSDNTEKKELNLKVAKNILEITEQYANTINLKVVIAVANKWGHIIAVHFMDDALPGSFDIAVNKAFTSASLRMPTNELGDLATNGQPFYGINNTNNNRIVIFAGGYPLIYKGEVVGAIGVSGGSAAQDNEIAAYGASSIKEVL
ncbi:cob(I)yrinic acid a,c-diamide adenosyltransferase [Clostridium grantii]|uniref:Corrinoid adenosyltransferase n=1 Tax=Clostridium grantii DSM 8605 TaxID=1121316 RepID=A0A1M5SX08_9CLOT|nr:cob(I)yrinic acid a,c-diamide adenosyltransferase [Clostridium grantii]SHH43047.1 ATP:cob(I)alamin adenosyltransferase [Clostridium grantii DSM 8605]